MNINRYFLNTIFLIIITALSFLLASYGAFQFLILFYLSICILGILKNRQLIISLYIMFLPIGGLISTTANIFGLIGIDEILNSSVIIVFIIQRHQIKFEKHYLTKLAILLIIIYLVYFNYVNFKNAYFDIYNLTYTIAIKRLIKSLLRYIPLILLMQIMINKYYQDAVILGVKFCIVLLTVSTVFSSYLAEFNISSIIMSEETSTGEIVRSKGIFSAGDINALGSFLVIAIGFFLSIIERKNNLKKYIFLILIAIIGILFTVSRTAFIGLGTVFLVFILRNFRKISGIEFLVFIIIGFIILQPFILPVISRFSYAEKEITGEEGTRLYKWILYLTYIHENPQLLNWGIDHTFYYRRGVHNFFIEVLFSSGLLIFTIFIYRYFRIIIYAFRKIKYVNIIYMVIPLFFISMFIGGFEYAIYFYIFLSIIPYITSSAKHDKIKYTQNSTVF